MSIRLMTMKDGKVIMDSVAKPDATLDDIMEIAECETQGGYADYARVTVDGYVYAEYEA